MASQLIGRCDCPWCGFASAHVKKSEKCLYMHCPECGAQYHTRGERQAADLMAKSRPEKPVGVPAPAPADPAMPPPPTPTATPPAATPAQAKARVGLFGLREA